MQVGGICTTAHTLIMVLQPIDVVCHLLVRVRFEKLLQNRSLFHLGENYFYADFFFVMVFPPVAHEWVGTFTRPKRPIAGGIETAAIVTPNVSRTPFEQGRNYCWRLFGKNFLPLQSV